MGRVFAARHIELDELVAIKVVLPQLESDTTYVNRLLREGRNAVKIRSEHVARILDVGRIGEGGTPFVVMEYLEGQDLAQVLRAQGPLSVNDACEHLLQACEAVASAHALGIVHRDLKPANLFLTRRADGSTCVKVLDFGICKVLSQTGMALTGNSALLGSPNYVSPEQIIASSQVDGAADVWSLGVLLFRLLTNRLPFEGGGSFEVMGKILRATPMALRAIDPSLPEDLERTVMRSLEKDRTLRLGLAEFAQAIANYASPQTRSLAQRVARLLPPKGGSEALVATRVPGQQRVDVDEDELVKKVWESTPPPANQPAAGSWQRTTGDQPLPTSVPPASMGTSPARFERIPTPLPISEHSRQQIRPTALGSDFSQSFDGAPSPFGHPVVNPSAVSAPRINTNPSFAIPPPAPPTTGPSAHPVGPSVIPVTTVVRTPSDHPIATPTPTAKPTIASKSSPPPSKPRRSKVVVFLAVLLAALCGVEGALCWRNFQSGQRPEPANRQAEPNVSSHATPPPSPSTEPSPASVPFDNVPSSIQSAAPTDSGLDAAPDSPTAPTTASSRDNRAIAPTASAP